MPDSLLDHFQAVVIDLDGVLTDTASVHAVAWKRALDQLLAAAGDGNEPFDAVADYRAHIDGRPRLEGASTFLSSRGIYLERGTRGDPPGVESLYGLASLKNSLFLAELGERGVEVFPDARLLVDDLVLRGMPRAVVTASENGGTVLGRAGLDDVFHATVTGLDARALHLAGKPAPDTYQHAANLLGVDPTRCIVIEDSVAGVLAGVAGSFGFVVGVDRDDQAVQLARSGANVVVKRLDDLLTLTDADLATSPADHHLVAPGDPRWSIVIRGDDPRHTRVLHTLLTVADTRFGTRGTREEDPWSAVPGVLAAGIFDESLEPAALLEGPGWTSLQIDIALDPAGEVRVLDLSTGILYRDQPAAPLPLRSARFASLARPGVQALRAEGGVQWLHAGPALTPPIADGTFTRRQAASRTAALSTAASGGGIAAATYQQEWLAEGGLEPKRVVDRIVALSGRAVGAPDADHVQEALDQAQGLGFDHLLAEQRHAWAQRWADAGIAIEGDPASELAVRYAMFHLMAAAPLTGEAAIGPRGLSGPTYRGHVFWDTDVFMLPFFAATCPPAARAMVRYRTRRLPAAERAASAHGRLGARFPWESARTGSEVTPTYARSLDGQAHPILTGRYEEHITADVAWGVSQLAAWAGRRDQLRGSARSLLVQTARYWASRTRLDSDGRGHIDEIMGPDEYHEVVDDNAFTNMMARWNLRAAAELAATHGPTDPAEAEHWRSVADALVDGYDPGTGVYEQFAGYHQLEAIPMSQLGEPPIAADLLLGRDRIPSTQIIKQADVLMAHHLIPDDMAPNSLRTNLDHYLPRCAHGSSLSPAIHASLLARDGRPDEALTLFDMSCHLDLEDLTGTTVGGLHMATFGGVWQAVVLGFAGIRPRAQRLVVDPHLPGRWDELAVRVRFQGARVVLALRHDEIRLSAERTLSVEVAGSGVTRVGQAGHIWHLKDNKWRSR